MSSDTGIEGKPSILQKIVFMTISLGNYAENLFLAAQPWLQVDLSVPEYVGTRIMKWWNKRGESKQAESIIRRIEAATGITKFQVGLLRRLVQYVRDNDSDLRKEMVTKKPLREICISRLMADGFDDRGLAEKTVSELLAQLNEILTVTVSKRDLYRDHAFLREEVVSLMREQERDLRKTAVVEFDIPISFSPLSRRLGHDLLVAAYESDFRGGGTKIPEPEFFRRPRPNWNDISNGYVDMREEVIERIEDNFRVTNMQLLVGESGAGKTTLSYILGFKRLTRVRRDAVFYVDLTEHSGEELDDIKTALISLAGLGKPSDTTPHGVLFILDNVHLNPELMSDIYEKLRVSKSPGLPQDGTTSELASRLDFLFVTRTLTPDLDKAADMLMDGIPPSDRGLMRVELLRECDYDRAVKGIVECYLEKRPVDHHLDIEKFTQSILEKSRMSIWLTSFVLKAVETKRMETGIIPQDVGSISICKEYEEYYVSLRKTLEEKDEDYKTFAKRIPGWNRPREIYASVLFILAKFNQFEVAVPEEFLHSVIQDEEHSDAVIGLIESMRESLLARGELLVFGNGRLLTLPHLTLASQMIRCADHLDSSERVLTHMIDPRLLARPLEDWCIQLLRLHGTNFPANRLLRERRVLGDRLVGWLLENHTLLKEALRYDYIALAGFASRAIEVDHENKRIPRILSGATIPELNVWRSAYQRLGFKERAEECAEAILSREPITAIDCQILVSELLNRQLKDQAFSVLRAWSGAHPEDNSVFSRYMSLLRDIDDTELIRTVLEEAAGRLEKNPHDKVVRVTFLTLVREKGSQEQAEKAIEDTTLWLREHPGGTTIREAYLILIRDRGTPEQAEKAIENTDSWLRENPEDKTVRSVYLHLVRKKGLHKIDCVKRAMDDAEEWMKEHGPHPIFMFYFPLVAKATKTRLGVEVDIELVKQLGRTFISSSEYIGGFAATIESFAGWLTHQGSHEESERIYEELSKAEIRPRRVRARVSHGHGMLFLSRAMSPELSTKERTKYLEKAEEKLKEALKLHKGHIARAYLAIVLREQKRYEKSKKEFSHAEWWARNVDVGYSLGKLFFEIGKFYFRFSRYKQAGFWYQRASSAKPEEFANWWGLGRSNMFLALVLEEQGRHAEAKSLFAKALRELKKAQEKAPELLRPPASEEIPSQIEECKKRLS